MQARQIWLRDCTGADLLGKVSRRGSVRSCTFLDDALARRRRESAILSMGPSRHGPFLWSFSGGKG